MMTAERLMLIGGVAAFGLTLYWVYSRELREKYAVSWLLIAAGLLAIGLFPETIMSFADASRLAYPSAVLFAALTAIYIFAMGVSITLSRQHRAMIRMAQELALLRLSVRRLQEQRHLPDIQKVGRSDWQSTIEPRLGHVRDAYDRIAIGHEPCHPSPLV